MYPHARCSMAGLSVGLHIAPPFVSLPQVARAPLPPLL